MFVPQGPEPQQLQVTLARLRKIVCEDRAGSPEIIEPYVSQTFRMAHIMPPPKRHATLTAVRDTNGSGKIRLERRLEEILMSLGYENSRPNVRSSYKSARQASSLVNAASESFL